MSNTQFAFLAANAQNLTPAQKVKIFLGTAYGLGSAQPTKTLTLASAIVANDTSITVTAGISDILYEGTRLNFGTASAPKCVYVAEQTAAAATAIPIEASAVAVTNASVATLKAWKPFFSAKTYNLDVQPQEISDNNFSDGLYMEKAIATLATTGSFSGPWVYQDPGLAVLEAAQELAQLVYCEVIYPGQRGGRYFTANYGVGESADRQGMIQKTVTPIITGAIGYLLPNP